MFYTTIRKTFQNGYLKIQKKKGNRSTIKNIEEYEVITQPDVKICKFLLLKTDKFQDFNLQFTTGNLQSIFQ